MIVAQRPSYEYLDLSLEYEGSWAEALNEHGRDGWQVLVAIHDESVKGDKELRVLLMRPVVERAPAKKRGGKSKTAATGHEVVEDDDSSEDAP